MPWKKIRKQTSKTGKMKVTQSCLTLCDPIDYWTGTVFYFFSKIGIKYMKMNNEVQKKLVYFCR